MNNLLGRALPVLRRLLSIKARVPHLGFCVALVAMSVSGCAGVRIVQAPGVSPVIAHTPAYQLKVAVKNHSDKESSPQMQLRVTMQLNNGSDVGGRGGQPDCNGQHFYTIAPLSPQQEWNRTELIDTISGCPACTFNPEQGQRCAGIVGLQLRALSPGGAKLDGPDLNVTWSFSGDPALTQVTEVPH